MKALPPIELLNEVSLKLGDLCQEVVFLGGAIVTLLTTEKGGQAPRATKDVDVAIELGGTIIDVYELDQRLLALGFKNDMEGPVCRYLHGPSVIDVIPVSPEALGGVNSWYPLAIATAQPHTLENGIEIKVIEPACFLGTKLAAFRSPSREYHDDVFLSRDFADMIRVIDGRAMIAVEVLAARKDLRAHIQEEFLKILRERYVAEAIEGYVDSGRDDLVFDRIRAFLP